MEQNAINRLEKELLAVLKEEYSFYQNLYIMLDKQKDLMRFNKDENLLDLFAEIERCHKRIKRSEEKITAIKEKDPKLFKLASIAPNVRKIVNSISTLVQKSISVVNDNEEYMNMKYNRIKDELGELKNSEKIMQYMQKEDTSPHFINGES